MAHDFDRLVERRGTESNKWRKYDPDVLPLWVADMDFPSPPPVVRALAERVAHGIFGYGPTLEQVTELHELVAARLARLHGWRVAPETVVLLPGVIPGFNVACRMLAAPGDGLLLPPRPGRRPAAAAPALPADPPRARQLRPDHRRRRPCARARRQLRGGLGGVRGGRRPAHARVPALQPAQPDGPRLPPRRARAPGGGLPPPRPRDRRRRDPRRPRLLRPPPHADRLARARGRRADHHTARAEQDLEPRGPQVRARGDPRRRAPRALPRRARRPGADAEHPRLHGGGGGLPRRRGMARGPAALPGGQPGRRRGLRASRAARRDGGRARGDVPRVARLPRRGCRRRRPVHVLPRDGARGAQRRHDVRARRRGVRAAELRLPARAARRGARAHAPRPRRRLSAARRLPAPGRGGRRGRGRGTTRPASAYPVAAGVPPGAGGPQLTRRERGPGP